MTRKRFSEAIRNARGRFARRVPARMGRRAWWSILRTAQITGLCVITERRKPAFVVLSIELYWWLFRPGKTVTRTQKRTRFPARRAGSGSRPIAGRGRSVVRTRHGVLRRDLGVRQVQAPHAAAPSDGGDTSEVG